MLLIENDFDCRYQQRQVVIRARSAEVDNMSRMIRGVGVGPTLEQSMGRHVTPNKISSISPTG